jgi:protein-tyrosine-phosphatase
VLRLLFVCVENANRSQMAEAFARLHGADDVEAWSAGSRPSGRINPRAMASMAERGIDLAIHHSTGLDELDDRPFDAAITMGCGDACPSVRAQLREDWDIPDPRDMDPLAFAEVRDDLERRVVDLIHRLRRGSA